MSAKYLFDIKGRILAEIKAKIFSKTKLVLLSDYDGTLTPIRKNPSMAILSGEVKDLINRLKAARNFTFGIVTGRSYKDIIKLVDCRDMIVISNHGFQINNKKKCGFTRKQKKQFRRSEIFTDY